MLFADNTYTYFYLVWATGYAVDLLPELHTTTTYSESGGVPATPADAQSFAWVSTNRWVTCFDQTPRMP